MELRLTILLVEDSDQHFADCENMLAEVQGKMSAHIELIRATTLDEALPLVEGVDGVLTDVFYPASTGDSAETPSGQQMVAHCLQIGKPVVWCTSTYHHGTRTNAVSEWGREHGLEMFDSAGAADGEAPRKPWDRALAGIVMLVVGVRFGKYAVRPSGVCYRSGKPLGNAINNDAYRLFAEE